MPIDPRMVKWGNAPTIDSGMVTWGHSVEEDVPIKRTGAKLNDLLGDTSISGLNRQLGLTARHGLTGLSGTLDMLASPLRVGLNAILPASVQISGNTGANIADVLRLPKPETQVERIVAEPAQMIAGVGGLLKGAQMASQVPGMVGRVSGLLAENPLAQLESATGAGAAGGYVKETGGSDIAQLLASIAGGVAAPGLASLVQGSPGAVKAAVEYVAPNLSRKFEMPQIDVVISRMIEPKGLKLSDLSVSVLNQMRDDVGSAMKLGGSLDDAALRRLADYRLIGAIPTRASITLDPADITRQKNAAKFGINSADPKLQQLGQVENANSRVIISNLNDLGGPPQDRYAAAKIIMGRLNALDDAAKARIDAAYDAARGTAGRKAFIDPSAFTQKANDMLDEAMLGGVIPADVRNKLNGIAEGNIPLTIDVAEQFKTNLGNLARDSNERSVKKALGIIRQALDDAPLLPSGRVNPSFGQESIDAFNEARKLNRSWMSIVDRVPALQAVRDGVAPDKFVNEFIIGNGSKASVMDTAQLKALIKNSPEAMQAVRGQIISHLKDKALGGASDEIGNVSQSNLNKALRSIGERKLVLFFSKPEIEQLKAAARVASYEQIQPRGSAVNTSNTAGATLATIFDRIANSPIASKIPLAPQMVGNISASLSARKALDIPSTVVVREKKPPSQAKYLLPAFAGLGLLSE